MKDEQLLRYSRQIMLPEIETFRDRLWKPRSWDLIDEAEELIRSDAPIEIEDILGTKLPLHAAFAPVSIRVAEGILILIRLKLMKLETNLLTALEI